MIYLINAVIFGLFTLLWNTKTWIDVLIKIITFLLFVINLVKCLSEFGYLIKGV